MEENWKKVGFEFGEKKVIWKKDDRVTVNVLGEIYETDTIWYSETNK